MTARSTLGSAAVPTPDTEPHGPCSRTTDLPPQRPETHHPFSLLLLVQSMTTVLVVALFIVTFTVQPFRIPSESMVPTLLVGDFLLADKELALESRPRLFAPAGRIEHGDLIVFHYPVDPTLHLVKRVIGLPGDRLHLHDGRVVLNGVAQAEPYVYLRPAPPDAYRDDFPRLSSADPGVDSRWWIQMHSLVADGELTVPPDSYFVLGDNRNDSEDSRYWGLVPRAAIVGKPFLVYLSVAGPRSDSSSIGPIASNASPGVSSLHRSPGDAASGRIRWSRTLRILR